MRLLLNFEPAINARADQAEKRKTVLPKIAAGGYKLPPSSLLQRPDDQQAINEAAVKELAVVLAEKCGEFDVRGAVTQINPGPQGHDLTNLPEAGVKPHIAASPASQTIFAWP